MQQPARVVAQVDDQALQPARRLLLQLGDLVAHAFVGLLAERTDADVADAALQARADRADLDHIARQRHVEGLAVSTPDGELDRCAEVGEEEGDISIKGDYIDIFC